MRGEAGAGSNVGGAGRLRIKRWRGGAGSGFNINKRGGGGSN